MKDIYALMTEGKTEEEIKALFEAEMKCAQARKVEEEKAKQENLKKESILNEARGHLVNAFLGYNEYYGWQDEPVTQEEVDELLELIIAFEESIMPYANLLVEAEKIKDKNKKPSDEEIISDFLKNLFK